MPITEEKVGDELIDEVPDMPEIKQPSPLKQQVDASFTRESMFQEIYASSIVVQPPLPEVVPNPF